MVSEIVTGCEECEMMWWHGSNLFERGKDMVKINLCGEACCIMETKQL